MKDADRDWIPNKEAQGTEMQMEMATGFGIEDRNPNPEMADLTYMELRSMSRKGTLKWMAILVC